MPKKPITLSDLKERGLILTKYEATDLLPHITEISHRGAEINVVFGSDKLLIEDYDDKNDDLPNVTIQSRIEYIELEDFVFNEEKQAWIDEEGTIVTKEEVYASYPSNDDFYTLVQERIVDAAPIDKNDPFDSGVNDQNTGEELIPLSEEQEVDLMATIGITTESSPEEYLNALNTFINGIDGEVPPKLLIKRSQLEEVVIASETNNADNSENKKEHYLTKRKRLKDAGLMEYTITQEDIDSARLVGKVGDIIEIPIQPAE